MSLTSQGSNNSGDLAHQKTKSNSSNVELLSPFYKYLPTHTSTDYAQLEPLKNYSILEQELLLVEDLLTLLYGLDGNYISLEQAVQLDQLPDLDVSQRSIVERVLPCIKQVQVINDFIDRLSFFEAGLINQALASAIDGLVKEYYLLLAQLETKLRSNKLGLNQFWFHFAPTLNTFRSLNDLIDLFDLGNGARFPKGGSTLDLIYKALTLNSGDPEISQLYLYLLKAAWTPFLSQLSSWIHQGEIVDPYQEFMVKEKNLNKAILNADFNEAYWQQRYTLRNSMIPRFLVSYSDKILNAGKYWNVLKECNSLDNSQLNNSISDTDPTVYDIQSYLKVIDAAYIDANRSFLAFLFKDKALLSKLSALKRYFFLEQSDFFTHFLDLAEEELAKPANQVTITKLQSLLELTLRNPASVTYYDPDKEDVLVTLKHLRLVDHIRKIVATEGIHTIAADRPDLEDDLELEKVFESLVEDTPTQFQLTGVNTLTLDFRTQFPYSLVISRKSLTKYQLIFRMLLQLKFVEQQLQKAWSDHTPWRRPNSNSLKSTSRSNGLQLSSNSNGKMWYGSVHRLRHAMLNLVQAIHYYVSVEVLEPNCQFLHTKLNSVETADQVFEVHANFLDTCLKAAMLTNSKLIYHRLMMTCERLTEVINSSQHTETQILQSVNQLEANFQYHVQTLLKALQFYGTVYCPTYLNLVARVDFNGYYTGLGFKK